MTGGKLPTQQQTGAPPESYAVKIRTGFEPLLLDFSLGLFEIRPSAVQPIKVSRIPGMLSLHRHMAVNFTGLPRLIRYASLSSDDT